MCTPALVDVYAGNRKGNLPSCSGCVVNLMLESRLLTWVVNWSTWYSWTMVNVSSTYLTHTEGVGAVRREISSNHSIIYVGLVLWATLVITWLVRVSVCISLHCMWNRGCTGRNSVVQGSSPVTEGYGLGDLGPRPIWYGMLWWNLVPGCWWTMLRHRIISVSVPAARLNYWYCPQNIHCSWCGVLICPPGGQWYLQHIGCILCEASSACNDWS